MKATMPNPAEMLEQVSDMYFKAVDSGIKMQQQAASWMTTQVKEMSGKMPVPETMESLADEAAQKAREATEQAMKTMEDASQQILKLVGMAFESGTASQPDQAQEKLKKLWETSVAMMKKNTDQMIKANREIMDGWSKVVKDGMARMSEAAKAATPQK